MEPSFWHQSWQNNRIAFHEGKPNSLLVKHLPALGLKPDACIFVPLCGKTADLRWLRDQGLRPIGAELSELAVAQFFEELGTAPRVEDAGALKRFSADGITIYLGNIFDLTPETLGSIDLVYDRAAMVAFPPETQPAYAEQVLRLSAAAPILQITFEYDQSTQPGPPFSTPETQLNAYYGKHYALELLERIDVPGGLKGISPAQESIWLLEPR
ncbi:thiopurine S-methyltransferase [Granulicella cerasi]|uniref:Thiopurine S-methyltransferase n=1 Tax=Granulicella cerasi TaxID=741063 RepID=A0ABW1Z576_9BACT|nr:thiopurine S-methyltransferase [Granulicella cerasi]